MVFVATIVYVAVAAMAVGVPEITHVVAAIDRPGGRAVVSALIAQAVMGELFARSEVVDLVTTCVRIASIEDLILLKRLANRPEDQRDIEALQAIRLRRRDRG
jgi:hypothetical protein